MEYDPEDGELRWKKTTSYRVKVGDCIGTINPDGYIQLQFFGKIYKAHRVIWFMIHGRWPHPTTEHKDRNRSNNRIGNIIEATQLENSNNTGMHQDNQSGFKGVAYDPKYLAKPWRVQISRKGQVIHRSHHENYEEACETARSVYEGLGSAP
jgi:hypothetical protein